MDFCMVLFTVSNKMGKRSRESQISIKETFDNHVIIEWNGRSYVVFNLEDQYIRMLNTSDYNCEITHNESNQAMINIENARTGEFIHKQEVNPEKYKDVEEWVEDVQ